MMLSQLWQVIRFGTWGLPGFLLGIALNFSLVEFAGINVYASYVYTLIVLTLMNYFIVDKIIFKSSEKRHNSTKRFTLFTCITLTSRALEWSCYSLLIYFFEFYYILVQIVVSILFVAIKYFVLKPVMN